MPEKAILYTRYDCGYSDRLKAVLDRDGVEYEEIDIAMQPEYVDKVLELTDGDRIVPVLVEGDKVTVGHNGIGCTF